MKTGKKIFLRAAGLILALLLIALPLAACSLKGAGADRLRKHTAISSENYTIDGAMMAYMFFETAKTMADSFTDEDLTERGFDENKKLSEQYYSEGLTWLDLFMNEARADVASILALCEEAHRLGLTLTDNEEASIESELYNMRVNIAVYYGQEIDDYLADTYGGYVAEVDIKNVMHLTLLATKAYAAVSERINAAITEAGIEAYGAALPADEKDTSLTRCLGTFMVDPDIYTAEDTVTPIIEELNTRLQAAAAADRLDTFLEFADEYDVSGSTLYENVAEGDMMTAMDEWLYDNSRRIGDIGIVSSDYGYHIMYYAADDDMVWVANAKLAIFSENYEAWRTEAIAAAGIEENEKVIAAIDY